MPVWSRTATSSAARAYDRTHSDARVGGRTAMPQMHIVNAAGLTPMTRAPFPNEDQLQDLLARFPDIMPGDLIDPDNPRRWLLVTREAGLAIGGGSDRRFSLDHLFVDQDGWPTLVEVKRASDTRGRREVVAQMLDYAASLRQWQPGQIAEVFANRCEREGLDADELVGALLDDDADQDAFWGSVDAHIGSGDLRLIFLSDSISAELRQIIEFLNDQFQRAVVLGVEVRQWHGEGVTTLVSDVVGLTATSQAAKRPRGPQGRLTAEAFANEMDAKLDEPQRAGLAQLMRWCQDHGGFLSYGTGHSWPACYLNWRLPDGRDVWPLIPTLPTFVTVNFEQLAKRPPFDDPALRAELMQRLLQVPGVEMTHDDINRRPSFPMEVLGNEPGRHGVIAVLAWIVAHLSPSATVSEYPA